MNRQAGSISGLQGVLALGVIAAAVLAGWYFAPGGDSLRPNDTAQGKVGSQASAPRAAVDVDPDGEVGGPFSLIDHEGERVTEQDFSGRYMLVVFGFTFCPDVCPMSLQLVTRTLDRLEQTEPEVARRITPVFVSLDPERDHPDVIKSYIRNFHPRMVGLTGSLQDIDYMAASYAVGFKKVTSPDIEGYLIDHTTNIMLMGPDGGYVTSFSPQTPADLMAKGLQRNVIARDSGGAQG